VRESDLVKHAAAVAELGGKLRMQLGQATYATPCE
jgi:hypothetical protein